VLVITRPPPALRHLDAALQELAAHHRLRERFAEPAHGVPSFCSNDYLGLAADAALPTAAGAGASRLVGGDAPEHLALEAALASWLRTEACLTFTSGYAANVGTVACLAQREDLIVSDALNHASLIDGARLSRASVVVVPHGDVDAVRRALRQRSSKRAWVLTESYFSMDADGPDLAALRAVCDETEAALLVDEAHALGLLGPEGRGLCAAAGITPDVLVGTLGKAFGGAGAFVAGCEALVVWLWNRARSFVFSTGISPALTATALAHLDRIRRDATRAARVAERARQLRDGLRDLGLEPMGFGHVVPVVLGSEERALQVARSLREQGFGVQAIRPPTVPPGTSRLRLTVTARHEVAHVEALLHALRRTLR
jgi:8-amino-7-oxononanoate synthase